jgi:uncharacterized protein YkwD
LTVRVLSVISAALLGLLLLASPSSARSAADFQDSVRSLTNGIRLDHDEVKLREKSCVQKYAVRQARKMAKADEMFHQDLGPVLKDCGLSLVGENVAYGYTSAGTLLKAWMDSPGHRANILEERYRQLGVGARKSDDGTGYVSQVFGRK